MHVIFAFVENAQIWRGPVLEDLIMHFMCFLHVKFAMLVRMHEISGERSRDGWICGAANRSRGPGTPQNSPEKNSPQNSPKMWRQECGEILPLLILQGFTFRYKKNYVCTRALQWFTTYRNSTWIHTSNILGTVSKRHICFQMMSITMQQSALMRWMQFVTIMLYIWGKNGYLLWSKYNIKPLTKMCFFVEGLLFDQQ